MIGLAVLAVALGWATVHTVYTLRYAHLYFDGAAGGIDFNGDKPDYLDFAYFGFTVGMTWQVSDTDVQSEGDPPHGAPPCVAGLSLRNRDRRGDDQPRLQPAELIARGGRCARPPSLFLALRGQRRRSAGVEPGLDPLELFFRTLPHRPLNHLWADSTYQPPKRRAHRRPSPVRS